MKGSIDVPGPDRTSANADQGWWGSSMVSVVKLYAGYIYAAWLYYLLLIVVDLLMAILLSESKTEKSVPQRRLSDF